MVIFFGLAFGKVSLSSPFLISTHKPSQLSETQRVSIPFIINQARVSHASKADIVKMIDSQPDLAPVIRRVRGGYLKIQGTWMPYEVSISASYIPQHSFHIRSHSGFHDGKFATSIT